MRCCVIFNPTAKGDRAKKFRAQLDQIARDAALKLTRAPGDAASLAADAVREGFEVIIAAGGDGTINEVINGIGSVPDGFGRTTLGVLPLGTVNVFARELALPNEVAAAWELLQRGKVKCVDLGLAESCGSRRYFVQLAGAGLDARAIELVSWRLKQRVGPLAYVWAGLKALVERKLVFQVRADGLELEGELVLIGNGRLYGGDFATFPEARLDDGSLSVCVFPKANWLTLLRCACPLLFKQRLPESCVRRAKAVQVHITGRSRVPYELDGELVGHAPVALRVEPGRLRVLVR
jgi:YegS/Rv2252/BmrU family lipid kinase